MPTHYEVLNVTRDADPVVIAAAYKALMKRHHPDATGTAGSEIASKLNEAYRVLCDEGRRAAYDRELARGAGTAQPYRPRYTPPPPPSFDYFTMGGAGPKPAAEERPAAFSGAEPGSDGFLGRSGRRQTALLALLLTVVPASLVLGLASGLIFPRGDGPGPAGQAPSSQLPGPVSPKSPVGAQPALVGGERPRTGVLFVAEGAERVVPLRVTGARGSDYYLKLVDEGGREAFTLFLRGGETLETRGPGGRYRLRYASGNQWLGTQGLFGPDTRFTESNNLLDFGGGGRPVIPHDLALGGPDRGTGQGHAVSRDDF